VWLIDTETYQLKIYHPESESFPHFAILSHTWGKDEVLSKDMKDLPKAKKKERWRKTE